MNIYVASLGFTASDEDLKQLFSPHGSVTSARVITDKYSDRGKGFGFVVMPDQAEAEKAIKNLNGSIFEGRAIVVNEAKVREQRMGDRRAF